MFLPAGEVVIGIDDTIERRWGARIKARGIYRDPVRSSHGHFVASGLRWLSLMVVVPIPWAGRRWALPFLTVLAPSERWSDARGRRHKKLTDWARQAILQAKHWLAKRRVIIVAAYSGFAALDLIAAVRRHVCLVTRLRLDASLFAPAPARRPGQLGRPRLKGARLPKLAAVLADPGTVWSSITLQDRYERDNDRHTVFDSRFRIRHGWRVTPRPRTAVGRCPVHGTYFSEH